MTPFLRSAIFCHRWLGIALCLVFTTWFCSGIVMMYWDFPEVTAKARLERLPRLDVAKIRVSPVEAYSKLGSPDPPRTVRLNTFDGRPVYRFAEGRGERLVYADNGELQTGVTPAMVRRIAAAWTKEPAEAAAMQSVEEPDQWTLEGPLRTMRPLWKCSWPNGEQVYVSGISGEVVQYTTGQSRFWAWLGAIPHWMYFIPLRKHLVLWTRVVEWAAATGVVSVILGLAVGIAMYSPRKRYRHQGEATGIPYRGQKRWHTVLGLVFGLSAATWAFSGFFSLDPFPGKSGRTDGDAVSRIAGALRGPLELKAFDVAPPVSVADPIRELELATPGGRAVYVAEFSGHLTGVLPAALDREFLTDLIRNAAGPASIDEIRMMPDYDVWYLDRHREKPLPVILVRLKDAGRTRLYIDPKTARIAGTYNSSEWVTRWLYHALHSWDLPWLYKYRPLWDVAVISFLLGGCALCVTSMVLAWRVTLRKLADYS